MAPRARLVAVGILIVAVVVAGLLFRPRALPDETAQTPPNYEMTLELQGTDQHPVSSAMVELVKERLALRLKRLEIPHEFRPSQAPRIVLRLRVPEGSDMSRPFDSRILTVHLVHDDSDTLLKSTATPGGWKVVERGALKLLVKSEALLVNDVHDATVTPLGGKFGVTVHFGGESAGRLKHAIREHAGKRIAVLVNDQPYMAARLEGEVPSGNQFLIARDFDAADANELALVLRSGMLPVPLRVVEGHFLR